MSISSTYNKRKILYVIVYLPGYAGHFLEYALSMAWSTYLHHNIPANMFDMTAHGYKHWAEIHHNSDYDVSDRLARWLESDNDLMVTCVHPSEFLWQQSYQPLRQTTNDGFVIRHLQVCLGDDYQYLLADFKARNGNWPWLRENELDFDRSIKESLPVVDIRLEYIMAGWDSFKNEIARLSRSLDQSVDFDARLNEFYNIWYTARQLHLYSSLAVNS